MLERLFIKKYLLSSTKGSVVRSIALISVVGVAIGVMAMVVVLSIMEGFDQSIKSRLLGIQPHIVVNNSATDTFDKMKTIVGHQGSVDPFSRQDVVVRTIDGLYTGAEAHGFETVTLSKLAKTHLNKIEIVDTPSGSLASGRASYKKVDFDLGPKEIAMGIDFARGLGVQEGDEVIVVAPETLLLPAGELPTYEKVKVKALLVTNVQAFDSRAIYYNFQNGLKKLQTTSSLEKGYEVRLNNPDKASGLATEMRKQIQAPIKTWEDYNAALFYSLKMEKLFMGLFLGLTILISSFSVVVVLVLLVTEKRMDVGILKSIGATRKQIMNIFVSIGLTLGFIGVGGGALLGLIICWILDKYPLITLPAIYQDTTVPVDIEYFVVFLVLLLGMALCFFGAYFPAWRTSKMEPVDSLRRSE